MGGNQPSQQSSNFANMMPFNMNQMQHYMQQPMDMMSNIASQTTHYGTDLKNAVGGLMLDTTQRFVDTSKSLVDGVVNVATTLPRHLFQETMGTMAGLMNLPTPALTHRGCMKKWCQHKSFGNNDGQLPMQMSIQPQNTYGQQTNGFGQQPNAYDQQPNAYSQQTNRYGQQPNRYDQQPNGQSQNTINNQQQPRSTEQSLQNMEYMPVLPNPVNPPQKIVRYGSSN